MAYNPPNFLDFNFNGTSTYVPLNPLVANFTESASSNRIDHVVTSNIGISFANTHVIRAQVANQIVNSSIGFNFSSNSSYRYKAADQQVYSSVGISYTNIISYHFDSLYDANTNHIVTSKIGVSYLNDYAIIINNDINSSIGVSFNNLQYLRVKTADHIVYNKIGINGQSAFDIRFGYQLNSFLNLKIAPISQLFIYHRSAKKEVIGRKWFCILRGDPDIFIPISSINGRLRSEGQSSLTIVCPDGINYASEILARGLNSFAIKSVEEYLDGSSLFSLSDDFSNLDVSYDWGSKNYSITLTGYKTISYNQILVKHDIKKIHYQALQVNGKRRIRCDVDKDVLPKDFVTLPSGEDFKIGAISYFINPRQMSMEITEQ